ncbi:NADP-dependent oxidoreductase domain-containing protein [Hypoxylon trugodes]|uniref:NADP-dependent oxidoreductase domain-containing protein n=1 Tax=Hypoxylon trugodes TaxID=326681 RepID=UPI00219F1A30|nr:NADP-dependent oxidoreductase domain-containing protein [Hypoxylon trugodes]KAI1388383.1 NADP-dependent oxidoreductase domain-containing protein [Hypoxylon trugodes]
MISNGTAYANGPTYAQGPAHPNGAGYSNGTGYSNGAYSSGGSYANGPSYGNGSTYQSNGPSSGSRQAPFIPNLKLNDGNEMPVVAFGLGQAFFDGEGDKVFNSALRAIRSGFTHFDAAEVYGNEKQLGQAIRQSGVPRSQLFVTTKVWTVSTTVKAAFDASLDRLGLDYVDLYLVNWPQIATSPDRLQQVWAEMEAIKQSGRARSIGVSNFLQEHLDIILRTARVKPAVNQIEYHAYLQHGNLVNYHRQHGIATAAYATLSPITKAFPGPVDDVCAALARKYGVSEVDIMLRWVLDQGIVAVTTTSNEERLQGLQRKLPTFKLTPSEIQDISEVGKRKHFRGYFNDIYGADDRR